MVNSFLCRDSAQLIKFVFISKDIKNTELDCHKTPATIAGSIESAITKVSLVYSVDESDLNINQM